ncbi:MAG: DNA cytosine methyltransferase [Dehalococcoidia bacterium]|jgi:DNA (cytosine-5)-methyltransferase 1
MLRVLDLFSGIGGFSLGLERTGGFQTIAFCEIDHFCRQILAKHWPGIPCFDDITELEKEELDGIGRIDVICGGFPCQPVSCAGKRKGSEDKRWLWPEFYRIVCEVKPEWVLVENVPGLLSADSGRLFAGILRDLAEIGYNAEWNIVSAASVGAPHLRKRVFIVAHAQHDGLNETKREYPGVEQCEGRAEEPGGFEQFEKCCDRSDISKTDVAHANQVGRHGRAGVFGQGWGRESENGGEELSDTSSKGLSQPQQEREHGRSVAKCDWWAVEPELGRVANGVPARVDRLRALGNAIVPQCSEYVGKCILEALCE